VVERAYHRGMERMRRSAAAVFSIFVVPVLLGACGEEVNRDNNTGRPAASTSNVSTAARSSTDLLPLDAACSRIWRLFKHHGNLPAGDNWDALTSGARGVLARSQPEVVAALEPEVDAFDAARIEPPPRGDDELIAAIDLSDRLIDDFADACGQEIVRSIDSVR
jgi:hypothetical protein